MQWIGQAGIAYPLHTLFFLASFCWRFIRLLEYLDGVRYEACGHLLQPPRLLEGARSHKKAGDCSKGDSAADQGLAQETGHLADLPPRPKAHTTAKV